MVSEKFSQQRKEKGGAWFFFLPILIIVLLATINIWIFDFKINEKSQKPADHAVLSKVDTDVIIKTAIEKYIAQQSANKTPSFDTQAHTLYLIVDTAIVYEEADSTSKAVSFLTKPRGIVWTKYKNGFVYIETYDRKDLPANGWIYSDKLDKEHRKKN